MILSDNPELQQQQLKELVHTSEIMLRQLTSPVHLFTEDELDCHKTIKYTGPLLNSYIPPDKRYAKISYH